MVRAVVVRMLTYRASKRARVVQKFLKIIGIAPAWQNLDVPRALLGRQQPSEPLGAAATLETGNSAGGDREWALPHDSRRPPDHGGVRYKTVGSAHDACGC